jgi:hypothetical protein
MVFPFQLASDRQPEGSAGNPSPAADTIRGSVGDRVQLARQFLGR